MHSFYIFDKHRKYWTHAWKKFVKSPCNLQCPLRWSLHIWKISLQSRNVSKNSSKFNERFWGKWLKMLNLKQKSKFKFSLYVIHVPLFLCAMSRDVGNHEISFLYTLENIIITESRNPIFIWSLIFLFRLPLDFLSMILRVVTSCSIFCFLIPKRPTESTECCQWKMLKIAHGNEPEEDQISSCLTRPKHTCHFTVKRSIVKRSTLQLNKLGYSTC